MRRRSLQLLVMVLLLALPNLAAAGGGNGGDGARHVDMDDDYFYPSTVKVAQGGTVSWDPAGDQTHTATDGTGMDLFDSGLVDPGQPSYMFAFRAASIYPVICTLHVDMLGRVKVPLRAGPRDGTASRPFDVTWASAPPDDGYVSIVQVKRPGRAWKVWKRAAAGTGSRFKPTTSGTYRFRSRLSRPSLEATADWSDVAAIRVRR
ncbi:MAG: hypothetical protein WD739_12040 [Actinomycetota bacterium]